MGFGIGWILIVGIIIFAITGSKRRRMHEMHHEGKQTAMDRLNERFIDGELDEVTYKNMKSVIRN